jgi:Zn-dependent metalloprotease
MVLCCGCTIIPAGVLDRFAADDALSDSVRAAMANTSAHSKAWRGQRVSLSPAARHARPRATTTVGPLKPSILMFDCKGSSTQPGDQIDIPETSSEQKAQKIQQSLVSLLSFYKSIFNRNSIDNNGMGVIASIHFAQNYCNAYWSGTQMIYGDGDGEIFADFALADDVLAHEFAHGVTQYTTGLGFWDQPGALNESASDVFGTVFRQWRLRQTCERADWMIGAAILGPTARTRGYLCLRSLKSPDAPYCVTQQPFHMRDYDPSGDPHANSGIPNQAFYRAAMAIGGNTWDRIALVWYSALANGRRQPNMSFEDFASLTIQKAASLFRTTLTVPKAIEDAWKQAGVI